MQKKSLISVFLLSSLPRKRVVYFVNFTLSMRFPKKALTHFFIYFGVEWPHYRCHETVKLLCVNMQWIVNVNVIVNVKCKLI